MTESNSFSQNRIIGFYLPLLAEDDKKKKIINTVISKGGSHIVVSDNPIGTNAFLEIERWISVNESAKFWTGITSPLYYRAKVLTSIVWSLQHRYTNRIGLGISTGDLGFLKNLNSDLTAKKAVDKLEKFLIEFKTLWSELQQRHDYNLPLPPVAVGGLGNRMIGLAAQYADILFLNSSRLEDIKRANKIIDQKDNSCSIVPLGLYEHQADPSLFSWYMVKKMLRFSPDHVLENYQLENSTISKIRNLDINYPRNLPQDEDLVNVYRDSIIHGDLKGNFEKIKKIYTHDRVQGMIFRVNFDKQFQEEVLDKMVKSVF